MLLKLLLVASAHGSALPTRRVELSADGEVSDWAQGDMLHKDHIQMMRHEAASSELAQTGSEEQRNQTWVSLPPGVDAQDTTQIISNNSGYQDEFLETFHQKEAKKANAGSGMASVGTLFFALTMFYLVKQPDKDLRNCTWQLLSGTLSFFCVVLFFMAAKKIGKVVLPGQGTKLAGLFSTANFLFMMFCCPLLRARVGQFAQPRPRLLEALRVSGAYLIGYAGADSFANIMKLGPWIQNPGFYFLGLLLVVLCLIGILMVAIYLVRRVLQRSDYDQELESEPVEALGFQIGFMISMWLRFWITGFVPGLKAGSRGLIAGDIYWMALAVALFAVLLTVVLRKVRPLRDDTEKSPPLRRAAHVVCESSAMLVGWLLFYFVQWALWFASSSTPGEDMTAQSSQHVAIMAQAIFSSALVIGIMLSMWIFATKIGRNLSYFDELIRAWALQLGFCWEVAIYTIVIHAIASSTPSPSSKLWRSIICVILLIAFLVSVWFCYILPQCIGKVGKLRKDAADGGQEAPAEEAAQKGAEAAAGGGQEEAAQKGAEAAAGGGQEAPAEEAAQIGAEAADGQEENGDSKRKKFLQRRQQQQQQQQQQQVT
eukprot:TRINITY_DN4693_c0_g1_i2.p1 TRINITY_DN4693_c0_g1~~TRINITY_DN4693_c0_g1_i2.p1  ORF type:complete len:599 (+),score=146.66 TRINITY_DN4693_c0_g1_i2:40-1836(+)